MSLQTDLSLSPGAVKLLRIRQGSVSLQFEPTIIPTVDAGPFLARPFRRPVYERQIITGTSTPPFFDIPFLTHVVPPGVESTLVHFNAVARRITAPTAPGIVILSLGDILNGSLLEEDRRLDTVDSSFRVSINRDLLLAFRNPNGFRLRCTDTSTGGSLEVRAQLWVELNIGEMPVA